MNLSDNLKKIRKENNLSQEDLAEKLGVSRQSVSKWESGLAYPEMDKVLQLCKLFDLNIDELLNQNVKEVKNNKQYKLSINKYIDDFLNYITKTINMFSSMRFRNKIDCLLEQLVIIFIMIIASICLKEFVFDTLIVDIISLLPDVIYSQVYLFIKDVCLVSYIILCSIILLHIFKIRYLDYYEFVYTEDDDNENDNSKEEDKEIKETEKTSFIKKIFNKENKHNKKLFELKKEKIIIRDPKHSEYKFFKGLFKCLLFCIKIFLSFIELLVLGVLVFLIVLLVLSCLMSNSGFLFIGVFIALLSCIIMVIMLSIFIYNFIFNKKSSKYLVLISFISVITFGIGFGISIVGIEKLEVINEYNEKYISKETYNYEMNNDLIIIRDRYYLEDDLVYVESDNTDVRVEIEKFPFCFVRSYRENNRIYYNNYSCDSMYNLMDNLDGIKYLMKLANDRVTLDPNYEFKVYVYSTKENIEKIKNNNKKYYEEADNDYKQERINELQKEVNELIEEKGNLQSKLFESEITIKNQEEDISNLKLEIERLNSYIDNLNNE